MKFRVPFIFLLLCTAQLTAVGNEASRLDLSGVFTCRGRLLAEGYRVTASTREPREAISPLGERVRVRYLRDDRERKAHTRLLQKLMPLMPDSTRAGFRLAKIREVPGSDYLEWPLIPGESAWERLEVYKKNLRALAALLRANFRTVQSDVERDALAWTIRLFDQRSEEFLGQLIVTPNANHVVYSRKTGSMTLILDVTSYSEDLARD